MTRPRAIIITGLIYFLKCTLETLTPSTNSSGAINVTINNSESKLNSTGMGVRYKNHPKENLDKCKRYFRYESMYKGAHNN